ncbi:hypothetical protein EDL99_00865 [Ornithobacterium rhinotracheale]|uniref:hypothetical protein n=1 Tax=Ornithobacterium rhinotracheale TaxID=28251 RepID=UPI00129CAA3E|nr:hypothetical protein [Ornithobacterium rhinotracheale]MRJ07437.1 hypothetical protein [Ornithobacterium rhinotracheale]UOH78034.1 hypothetical protein MT996_00860 [Ornithobacterium rhinotracheale]
MNEETHLNPKRQTPISNLNSTCKKQHIEEKKEKTNNFFDNYDAEKYNERQRILKNIEKRNLQKIANKKAKKKAKRMAKKEYYKSLKK